jgi:hypothetical protein
VRRGRYQTFCQQKVDALPAVKDAPLDGRTTYTLPMIIAAVEYRCMVAALFKTGWVVEQAARLLGISARALAYRMRQLGIQAGHGSPRPPAPIDPELRALLTSSLEDVIGPFLTGYEPTLAIEKRPGYRVHIQTELHADGKVDFKQGVAVE